jgi:hypothetical protein
LSVAKISTSPQDHIFGATSQRNDHLITNAQCMSSQTNAMLDHPIH